MRKFLLLFLFIAQGMLATAQVGVHTDFPDNSSAMDIVASNRGLLIPRVTLTSSLANPSPVTAPAVGLLVFNSGPNQAVGFYFWNGTTWVAIGSGGSSSGNAWTVTGNAGTIPGTNFLGTTDNNHFLVYTNNTERMRFESDGQVIIGGTAPSNATDLFTVFGNSTQKTAYSAYSPGTGFYTNGGRYGLFALVDTAVQPTVGTAVFARNIDPFGFGSISVGSNISSFVFITNHTAGITTYGVDGLHSWGRDANGFGIFAIGSAGTSPFNISGVSAGLSAVGNYGIIARGTAATGRGIIAMGSAAGTPSISNESEGGAFTGYHGIYARGINAQGIGVIGVGSNVGNYSIISGGLGGSFSGNYGVYGKGVATEGVGVLGVGSNGSGYYTVTGGSGGAFTGYHGSLSVGNNTTSGIGVVGAGNNGVYTVLPSTGAGGTFTGLNYGAVGLATNSTVGSGIAGAGNNAGFLLPPNGAGGSFSGNTGVYGQSVASNGTGIIGMGNNIVSPITYTDGSGGSFIGTAAGVVGYGTTSATGIGVIGSGNNATINVPATGAGGAFTGVTCGVYGYATSTSGLRYGGYFAAAGNVNNSGVGYAYVGGRAIASNGTTYQTKIVGAGSVQTIVKSTEGKLIALTCPETPEMVFQDFGIGQLVNGFAHISIDPNLAINLNISEKHPLKVYITPEGNCNGMYVTNKSVSGFDVIELMGGTSNVPFSWQIVATRGNEEFIAEDGSTQISDYSSRFPPAPGPLEFTEQPAKIENMIIVGDDKLTRVPTGEVNMVKDLNIPAQILEVKEDTVIKADDDFND